MGSGSNLRDWSGGKRPLAWLIVYAGWMSAFYIKLFPPTFPILLLDQLTRPVSCDFFPAPFVAGEVALAAFLAPALTAIAVLFAPGKWRLASSWILFASATVLLLHIKGYNDATYAVLWWSSLWMIWWAPRVSRDDPCDLVLAERFAKAVVSLCFLGGAVGKLTPEYWNGEVLERIYFHGKSGFPFEAMRENYSAEQLLAIATVFSRVAIVTEAALATAILWPTRPAAFAAVLAMIGMLIVSKIQLYSVLGALIALMIAALYLHDRNAGRPMEGHALS